MHFPTSSLIAEVITTMAHNLWDKRDPILASLNGTAYFCFRINVADRATYHQEDGPADTALYVHFVIEERRWYYTLSEDNDRTINHDELRFVEDDNDPHYEIRAARWNHYAFTDLLEKVITKRLDTITAGMESPSLFFVPNLFPLVPFRGRSYTDHNVV